MSCFRQHTPIKDTKKARKTPSLFGADNRIRTDDLMLTKHVLYQLSYISIANAFGIIAKEFGLVNTKAKKLFGFFMDFAPTKRPPFLNFYCLFF